MSHENTSPNGDDSAAQNQPHAINETVRSSAPNAEKEDPIPDPDRRFSSYPRIIGKTLLGLLRPSCGLPVALALLVLPVLSLAIWIPLDLRRGEKIGLSSIIIGGSLTQTQAKAIDVMSTAIFAPSLVFCLDFYWFSAARVTVNNEETKNSVPLGSLVEAGKVESGTYNPRVLFRLLNKENPKSFLLALLVLVSAAAFSALQNVIAYEAFPTHAGTSTVKVCQMNDFARVSKLDSIPSYSFDNTNFTTYVENDYNYTQRQQSDFLPQISEVLTKVAFENALKKLDDGKYVGINATQASRNALPPEFISLTNVPGYRLGTECQARPPDNVTINTAGTYNVAIDMKLENEKSNDTVFRAEYPGRMDVYTNVNTTKFAFAGFLTNQAQALQVYLGRFVDSKMTLDAMPSPYGDVIYKSYNMTAFGFNGTKATMSAWGIICNMTRQTGLHNLTRKADLSWEIKESTWSDDQEMTSTMVEDWQKVLNFQTPTTNMPGWAPALLSSAVRCPVPLLSDGQCGTKKVIDYQTYAMNFLYVAGEIERILYEIKNAEATVNVKTYLQVTATQKVLRYRMTYVPLILLGGILSILFAAVITLSLILLCRQTISYATWREVDILRIVVDTIDGVQRGRIFRDLHDLSNDEMKAQAKLYRVRYFPDTSETIPVVRLCGTETTESK
ncbi:uncharacterized protein KY384_002821 [Bacidia gigantensis]|uniref:uncharacterized protein n=1 Tax=Bacidia gigantensis TaxID=2732470 RepID=UPI001D044829|nr:uncharacterized protein KY384_002821 [Bacidia gigantensis]KAG8532943.1 hypothetical protein KY384_002821 [Bacidia gigantensis]